jgi:gliding motility-associated-like protein
MITWISPIDPSLPSGMQTLPLTFEVMPSQTTEYIAEITSNSCTSTDTATVFVEPVLPLSISVGPDPAVDCAGGPITFFADASGGGPTAVISWLVNGVLQPGENGITFTLANPQTGDIVRAEYTTPAGCSGIASSNAINVITGDGVNVTLAGSGSVICVPVGETVSLFAAVSAPSGADVSITWESSAELSCVSGCNTSFITPETADTVLVLVRVTDNVSGCTDVDSVYICGIDIPFITVPSAFTPNGDADNDIAAILGDTDLFLLSEFKIYNRWGELVFSTGSMGEGWDGTYKGEIQNVDVYSWYVNATFIETQEQVKLKGVLALLR